MNKLAYPVLPITHLHNPNPTPSPQRHLVLMNWIPIQLLCSDKYSHSSLHLPHQGCTLHLTLFLLLLLCPTQENFIYLIPANILKQQHKRIMVMAKKAAKKKKKRSLEVFILSPAQKIYFQTARNRHCGSVWSDSYIWWWPQTRTKNCPQKRKS